MLSQLAETFGGERYVSVSREITKRFEETCRGTLQEVIAHFLENAPRGEFVVVLAGKGTEKEFSSN
jgi:16S rRNA (cytidine1402-2'-O)-methyltransferase